MRGYLSADRSWLPGRGSGPHRRAIGARQPVARGDATQALAFSEISLNLSETEPRRVSHVASMAWLRTETWNFVMTMMRKRGLRKALRRLSARSSPTTNARPATLPGMMLASRNPGTRHATQATP